MDELQCKFYLLLKKHYVEIVQLIVELIWGNLENLFFDLCEKGDLSHVQFLLEIQPQLKLISKGNKAFRYACKGGNLCTAKWIYEKYPNINLEQRNKKFPEKCYLYACISGNIEFVKWLYEIKPDWKENNFAFGCCCNYGQLEIAKYLLNKHSSIDISQLDELPFRVVCENGYLEIAKWLLDVKPNINVRAEDDYAFVYAAQRDHCDVTEWLASCYPETYEIHTSNGETIFYRIF